MKQKLINSIERRLNTEMTDRSPLRYLCSLDIKDYIDTVISVVYLYTRSKKGSKKTTIFLTEVISAIGHGVRNRYKFKRDSSLAAKTGAFLLYSFEELGYLEVQLGAGPSGHGTYIIQVIDDEAICQLWNNLEPGKVEKLPSDRPYAPWESSRHETGAFLVKTGNKGVLDSLNPDDHPMVFGCVNKAQQVGWTVNEFIYDLHLWALRNKTEAFSDIWELSNLEARATKIREARAVGAIAKRFLRRTFYHLYYFDFRGRKYPATAYLHEQGSDLARGMLLRADSKPIGREGYFWLMVSIASNWAGDSGRDDGLKTDKLPLRDRYLWTIDNEEIMLSYAENPKVNQGWMKADKPWQFLAACNELKKLRIWQYENGKDFDNYAYPSQLECFIDGSNNGSQHLAALTRDEVTAPHVNLVPLDLPGDLYKYVADGVWARLKKQVEEMPRELVKECERFIDNLIELKKAINESEPKSDRRAELVAAIQAFKAESPHLMDASCPVFWMRVRDQKHRRKAVKRNVMTLPYGGTAYGLGEMLFAEYKHL